MRRRTLAAQRNDVESCPMDDTTNDTANTTSDTREYERMRSGALYIADDAYLHELGARRRRLQQAINTSAWDAFDERERLFRELFATYGAGSHIEPPFRCDYGCNITIGRDFYANTDCIILDVAPVTIGDNVFFGPRHPRHRRRRT